MVLSNLPEEHRSSYQHLVAALDARFSDGRSGEIKNCAHCSRQESLAQDYAIVNSINIEGIDLATAQSEDEILHQLLEWKRDNKHPVWQDISAGNLLLKEYLSEWDSIDVQKGILCRRWYVNDSDKSVLLPIVPSALQETVMKFVQDNPMGGHFGSKKTANVKERYYWMHRSQSVRDWCRNLFAA